MGLDLAIGGVIFLAAIRGWMKGFLVQAIRLAALVGTVYLAVPVRDQAKPYAIQYLPTMKPELADRLLWWGAAVLGYFVMVGVASLAVGVARKPKFGVEERNRGDQFAGLGLGVIKGAVMACFLVAGLERYAVPNLTKLAWVEQQTKQSQAWDWNERFHPASRIWSSPPVRHFVAHVQRMGLMSPPHEGDLSDAEATETTKAAEGDSPDASEATIKTASRSPKLALGRDAASGLDTSGLDADMARTVEEIQRQLRAMENEKAAPASDPGRD